MKLSIDRGPEINCISRTEEQSVSVGDNFCFKVNNEKTSTSSVRKVGCIHDHDVQDVSGHEILEYMQEQRQEIKAIKQIVEYLAEKENAATHVDSSHSLSAIDSEFGHLSSEEDIFPSLSKKTADSLRNGRIRHRHVSGHELEDISVDDLFKYKEAQRKLRKRMFA